MTLLLVILAMLVGFYLGIKSTIHTIQTRYPKTWLAMALEMADKKRKEAQP